MRTAIFLTALALTGCNTAKVEAPPPVPGHIEQTGDVVFTINGDKKVTQNMMDAVTAQFPADQLEKMKASGQMKGFYDQLALGELLYAKAVEEKLHEDPMVLAGLSMSSRQYMAGIVVQRTGDKAVNPDAIAKYYEDHKVQYARPQVEARHILIEEESKANEVLAKVKAGGDFAALAVEFSKDTGSKAKGGSVGWFEKGRMVEEFSNAAFAAEKGAIVGPVETRFGFHIIEVLDKRDATPLEEVKPQIEQAVRKEAIDGFLEGLKKDLIVVTADGADAAATPPGGQPSAAPGLPPGHPPTGKQAPPPRTPPKGKAKGKSAK